MTDQTITLSAGLLLWGGRALRAAAIVGAGWVAITLGRRLIIRTISSAANLRRDERRARTLAALLQSILRYAVDFLAVIAVFQAFDIPTASFLAGAGIVGLALGFGAQNLVRDMITGFFLIYEDQFAVGDYVTIGELSGTVEEMGLRVTKLRDFSGDMHIIPNGSIDRTTNHSRGAMRAMVDVGIAYEEDLDRALAVLADLCRDVANDHRDILVEGPSVLGVTDLGPSEVRIRITAMTKPMQQWTVERALRKRITQGLAAAGIEIPYQKYVTVPARSRADASRAGSDQTSDGRPSHGNRQL
ncbi:MAG: mechanosensitive ion channel family protein [Chloroflexota bacterium]